MAKITWTGDEGYNLALIDFGYLSVASSYQRSSSKYVVKYPYSTKDSFTGSGFTYSGNTLKSGAIKTYVGYDEGDKTVTISGLSLSASAVMKVAKTATITDDVALLKKALSGADSFFGGSGKDAFEGFGGNDTIYGGGGADILSGGSGRDTFLYKSTKHSGTTIETADIILDFTKNDRIDLSAIDANTRSSKNQAFKFIGSKDFTNHAGELRFKAFSSETIVETDVNGDGKADFSILFDDKIAFKKDYFIL
jgi:Ca2+-binding RTX toxin-like protein